MFCTNEGKSFEELSAIPLVPAPRAGNKWEGIEHSKLMDLILLKLREREWTAGIPTLITSKDGADFAGWLPLTVPSVEAPEGQRLAMGVVNSNAMHGPLKLLVGTSILLSNQCIVLASVTVAQKRIQGLDLDSKLDEGLRQFRIKAKCIGKINNLLQKRYLNEEDSNRILMNAGRLEMMPFSRIGRVDELYRRENHKTSWSLLLSFATVVKMNPPLQQMDQLLRFFRILPR